MFAIDTNILVYAHNKDSEFHEKAALFLENAMNTRDQRGALYVCIPSQVLTEFINVITRHTLKSPLSLSQAIRIVQDYLDFDVQIIHQADTQIQTLLDLLASSTSRKKIFDVAIAATLKDNKIEGIYTLNVNDFKDFEFLKVINPLQE